MTVFLVLSFNSDAPGVGHVEGVYTTKRLAFKRMLAVLADHEENMYRRYDFRDCWCKIQERTLDE